MDIADSAGKQVEQFTEWAAHNRKPEGPPFTGTCAHCGEDVAAPRRWCDKDCLTAFEKLLRRNYGAN